MVLHDACYVASNSNQVPTVVHWGRNGLICYGSCNSVLIYDPNCGSGGKITQSLIGHSKRVNSVRWINGEVGEGELVSGSSDSTAIVWTLTNNGYTFTVLKGHKANVNIVDSIYKGPGKSNAVVVTVSMDSTVKVWLRAADLGEFMLVQDISYGQSLCVSIRLAFLPDKTGILMACAPDDSSIQLFVEDPSTTGEGGFKFKLSTCLKGHEDWVRGLDFTTDDSNNLILASSSQDMYIRIWRITFDKSKDNESNCECSVHLDSVLTGHEGWVYSVNWSPTGLTLLSASLDKSMVIWELNQESNLWLEKIRVGEIGGNTLGFYGGLFGPDGQTILAHSYNGAFHMWTNNLDSATWTPRVTLGGHFAEVTDLSWDRQGEYVMSVSADQTTRLHAPWSHAGNVATWHEIARPQVHGYDMNALAILSRYEFASSAEEKLIRTFTAPQNFVDNFKRITNAESDGSDADRKLPEGACVPSLGLSNKAVFASNGEDAAITQTKGKNMYEDESHFTAVTLSEPPTEETLLQNTLWPENQKLYGHGYEVYSLASSSDGKYLASACKSTTLEHAAIFLWDTTDWRLFSKLKSHTLTVVQMAFSPDSQHLLSVSRDRRWSLFKKEADYEFELVATTDKKSGIHTRIIWCCGWSHDSKHFATGSRDGRLVVWTRNPTKNRDGVLGEYETALTPLELKGESVTAVAFAPNFISSLYFVGFGLESGVIKLYHMKPKEGWIPILTLEKRLAHHLTIRRLVFRPVFGEAGTKKHDPNVLQLASCSDDFSVKVHTLRF